MDVNNTKISDLRKEFGSLYRNIYTYPPEDSEQRRN